MWNEKALQKCIVVVLQADTPEAEIKEILAIKSCTTRAKFFRPWLHVKWKTKIFAKLLLNFFYFTRNHGFIY